MLDQRLAQLVGEFGQSGINQWRYLISIRLADRIGGRNHSILVTLSSGFLADNLQGTVQGHAMKPTGKRAADRGCMAGEGEKTVLRYVLGCGGITRDTVGCGKDESGISLDELGKGLGVVRASIAQ
jgi:hypothetical protein